ncbi:hypothetical protein L218DRAFT_990405 [Marasmius fiardii PR-910]|nr:hypothetical protein L218DRAFT_990405 [Marasmius fiardii PR-910]
MGEFFQLLNLDKEEVLESWGFKWGGMFCHDLSHLEGVLRRIFTVPPDPTKTELQWQQKSRHLSPPRLLKFGLDTLCLKKQCVSPKFRVTIHNLLNKLHAAIFSFISDYETALCLGITSQHFWAAGKIRISSLFLAYCANPEGDAGCRLIFLGDLANDLPRKITHAPQKSDRLTFQDAYEIGSQEKPAKFDFPYTGQKLVLDLACDDVVSQSEQFQPWVKPFEGMDTRSQKSILRNLDTLEYFTQKAGPDVPHRGLEYHNYSNLHDLIHKLALRASWKNIGYGHNVPAGSWAGDRFDIVPESDLRLMLGEDGRVVKVDGWTDVTDDVLRDLRAVLNYGL